MPKQAQATSGACSSHGGVNCSAGMQSSGTVYCNDGWTDSMVQYEFMAMCQNGSPMAGLDSECVNQAVEEIKARDQYIVQTDKAIADYREYMKNSMDMSNPINAQAAREHLNYLYTLRGRQNQLYVSMVVDACKNYKKPVQIKTNDQICQEKFGNNVVWSGKLNDKGAVLCDCIPGLIWNTNGTICVSQAPSGTLCNGKYWGVCPVGYEFYCPSSGDPQCLKNEELAAPISTTNNIPPTTVSLQDASPIIKKEQVKSERTTITDTDNKAIKIPPSQKGLVSRVWSWFMGLLGF